MDRHKEYVRSSVVAMQDRVRSVLLHHVPECERLVSELLRSEREEPIGPYQLLLEFGNRFLVPHLTRDPQDRDLTRRIYLAVEELLSDPEEAIAEAACFGTIEILGSSVDVLAADVVGPRATEEIRATYPRWRC